MLLDLDLARSNDDVRRVWMLHGLAPRTGQDKLSYSTTRDWWRRYPEGVTLLREGEAIVGAAALWPLCPERWGGFADGLATATQLAGDDLHDDAAACTTWFFSGVALRKYRRTHALPLLLGGVIERWSQGRDQGVIQRIVTLPMSAASALLARRFGGEARPLHPSAPEGVGVRVVIAARTAELCEHLRSTLLLAGG